MNPAILRQTDRATHRDGAVLPAGTGVLIHVPFLHRNDERLPFDHRFAPELSLGDGARHWTLIPLSGGTGECPARNPVLRLASRTLASLLAKHGFAPPPGRRIDARDITGTFDHFSLTLTIEQEGSR